MRDELRDYGYLETLIEFAERSTWSVSDYRKARGLVGELANALREAHTETMEALEIDEAVRQELGNVQVWQLREPAYYARMIQWLSSQWQKDHSIDVEEHCHQILNPPPIA